jgi:transposase
MRAYGVDLRWRVVEAVQQKEGTHEELAGRFSVSVSWIKKMVSQWKQLGTLEPQTHHCGRKPKLSEEDHQRLAGLVEEEADATLEQYQERLGVNCCLTTIWKALCRLRQTFKKECTGRRAGPAGRRRRPRQAPPPSPADRSRPAAFV